MEGKYLKKNYRCFTLDGTNGWIVATCVLLSFLCYVVQSIGLVSPHWVTYDQKTSPVIVAYYYGLWSECSATDSGPTACVKWDSGSLTDAFRAAQAFGLLAFILRTCAEVGAIVFAFHDCKRFHKVIALVTGSLFLVSGVLTVMSAIFLAADNSHSESNMGWSFGFSLFGGTSSVIFGLYLIYIYITIRKRDKDYKNVSKVPIKVVKDKLEKY